MSARPATAQQIARPRAIQLTLDLFELTKPKVQSLLLFTTVMAMYVAGTPSLELVLLTLVGGYMSAGGAGAVNHWYDRDIDIQMARTALRPIPSGRVSPGLALAWGVALWVGSILVLGLTVNWLAAALSSAGFLWYVFVYTLWLKRRTPQNIVIGGAAGAFPPMIGWAAVTGDVSLFALVQFLIIFLWTPPHFWALALFMKEDYHKAGVPMLTVTHGRPATRKHIFAYTLVLAPFAVALGLTSIGGPLYLAVALVFNALFILGGWRILRRTEEQAQADSYAVEKSFFRLSLYYLAAHFAALAMQVTIGGWL